MISSSRRIHIIKIFDTSPTLVLHQRPGHQWTETHHTRGGGGQGGGAREGPVTSPYWVDSRASTAFSKRFDPLTASGGTLSTRHGQHDPPSNRGEVTGPSPSDRPHGRKPGLGACYMEGI